jgi:hypothetical protein
MKGQNGMRFIKISTILALSLAVGFLGCSTDKKAEAPKQERVEKNLAPPKAELKGPNFAVELTDLKVIMVVDTASKEITETPNLRGRVKITNKSKDVLEIQGITLEYLNDAGKPIAFSAGEKIATVYPFWKAIKPEEITEGSLDVTIPKMAVKEKALGKIEINLVYVPSPLKRETLTLAEKIE